jgi:capsular exopolysaccharide synthesis family protein
VQRLKNVGSGPGQLSGSIAAHKWGVLAVVVVVTGLVVTLSYQQTPKYSSEARVLVRSEESAISPEEQSLNIQTEREIALSTAVADIAAKQLPLQEVPNDPEALAQELSVELLEETEILEFSYTHTAPVVARERAQAFAQAYIDFRRQQLRRSAATSAESLEQEISILDRRLNLVGERIGETVNEATIQRLRAQETTLLNLLLQKELERAELADVPAAGSIIQPAELPRSPSSPNHLVDGVFGLLLGVGAGIGYAALRLRRDERIPSQDRLEDYLGAPVLGTVSRIGGRRKRSLLVTSSNASPELAEEYRILRTNLLSVAEGRVHTIVVTSARPGEGKSVTAANLALVIARPGRRVALVSGDLRNHRLSELFGLGASPGLTDVLVGKYPLERVLVETSPNLELVPGGSPVYVEHDIGSRGVHTATPDPAHLLGSPRMAELLTVLTGRAELVIIDAPPVLDMADTLSLVPLADGVLFVADGRRTVHGPLARARKQLDHVNAHILGVVVNNYRRLPDEEYALYPSELSSADRLLAGYHPGDAGRT